MKFVSTFILVFPTSRAMRIKCSFQLHSCVQLFVTPWTAACRASLSITSSLRLLTLMSIKSVIPSNHLILCPPILLLPSIFPSIRVFSSKSALCIKWPKYWSFRVFSNELNVKAKKKKRTHNY